MRTTITLDDELVARAHALTGIKERSALVRSGLEALIQQESARRLAALGGSDHNATAAPRSRGNDAPVALGKIGAPGKFGVAIATPNFPTT